MSSAVPAIRTANMDRERERERKHHVRGARRKGRPGRRGDHSFIPASREVASVPLIQFIGGWKPGSGIPS
jgi:hypothetical protein